MSMDVAVMITGGHYDYEFRAFSQCDVIWSANHPARLLGRLTHAALG